MKKEIIKIENNSDNEALILNQGDDGDSIEFKYIEEYPNYFDGEKGFQLLDVILKRVSDGKFFRFEKYQGGAGHKETDFRGREVIPREIIKIIYE